MNNQQGNTTAFGTYISESLKDICNEPLLKAIMQTLEISEYSI